MSELSREDVKEFLMMAGEAVGQPRFADALAADWLRLHDIVAGQLLDVDKLYGTVAQHAKDYEQVKAELGRYSMSAGMADQYKGEAIAARVALRFRADGEDVSPSDIAERIADLTAERDALRAEVERLRAERDRDAALSRSLKGM